MTEDEAWDLLLERQKGEAERRAQFDAWTASGDWIERNRGRLEAISLRYAFETGYLAAVKNLKRET